VGALVESHMGMVFCVASDATRIVSYVLLGLFLIEVTEWLHSTSHDATMAVQDCKQHLP
jgi:hypothetical protein